MCEFRIELCAIALYDLPGKHHSGCFAADLAPANSPLPDGFQVADCEKLARQPHKVELIAEHALGQDDHHLFQVMLYPGFLLERVAFVLFAARK